MTNVWQRFFDPLEKNSEETVTKACQLFPLGKQPDQCALDAKLSFFLNSKSVADAKSDICKFAHETEHIFPFQLYNSF